MAAKKKARKAKTKTKAKSTSRKRSTRRSVKDLSARRTAKSVKGGLLPAVKPATLSSKDLVASKFVGNLNPGALAAGDGSV
jgi:hypothetical protein